MYNAPKLEQRAGKRKLKKLKLHGFNNLTKNLSFNIYDICYAKTPLQRQQYIEYIDEAYNARRLTEIMCEVTNIIGAYILNIAHQDYDPQGASVTMLIAEEPVEKRPLQTESPGPIPESVVAHLDKSHIAVHTYPESHPDNGICTFRADIDVSTCGLISPLKALNYLIHTFESDIVTVDYRVRGFTRDVSGEKHFIDHRIHSIQNYFTQDTLDAYEMIDVNVYQENVFHTKMLLKDFDLDNYLFGMQANMLTEDERQEIRGQLKREMLEIFYGKNLKIPVLA
ncbi:MAG: adenosylmethionine decarboxylase [Proteobacteria bacterium]|nr:adenosylmethionine decarboxylase [Pseudomonadota bacterium]